jgi:hypothetical protein
MNSQHCLNCSTTLTGKFCVHCGQKASVHRYSMKHFVEHDLVHGVWHLDSGLFFTIKKLFTTPGHSIRGFIQGKRVGFFSVVTLLILIMGFSHFLSEFSGVKVSDLMPNNSHNSVDKLEDFTKKYPKLFLLFTIPIYAIVTFIWFRKSKLNLTEHVLLNAYKIAAELILALLFTVLTLVYTDNKGLQVVYTIVTLITVVYGLWYYRQFFSGYDYSKGGLIFRAVGAIMTSFMFTVFVGLVLRHFN